MQSFRLEGLPPRWRFFRNLPLLIFVGVPAVAVYLFFQANDQPPNPYESAKSALTGAPGDLEPLTETLEHIRILSTSGTNYDIQVLGAILENSKHVDLRNAAASGLVRIGPRSVTTLVNLLKSPDSDVRLRAVNALAQVSSPLTIQALREVLGDKDPSVWTEAAKALSLLQDLEGIARLEAGLKNDDVSGRCAAVRALGQINHPAAARLLRSALYDSDSAVRVIAAAELAKMKDQGETGSPAPMGDQGSENPAVTEPHHGP